MSLLLDSVAVLPNCGVAGKKDNISRCDQVYNLCARAAAAGSRRIQLDHDLDARVQGAHSAEPAVHIEYELLSDGEVAGTGGAAGYAPQSRPHVVNAVCWHVWLMGGPRLGRALVSPRAGTWFFRLAQAHPR